MKEGAMLQRLTALFLLLALAAISCALPGATHPTMTPALATPTVTTRETVAPTATAQPSRTPTPAILTVMTHDSFAVSESVVAAFEAEHNASVRFLMAGDTGQALSRAILSRGNPLADVFYGVDNTFLSRALSEDIFEVYDSPLLADIPESFQLDPTHHALPVDYGDVCLNYDRAYFDEHNLRPPQNLEDLTRPEYRSLLVVENPATSSPGLAFLLATIGHFGPDRYLDFWTALRQNEVLVVDSWETAYYTEFSGSSGAGPRPIVVSYGSSPPFEVIYAAGPLTGPPTAAVVSDDTCFRQIEFVGILQGTANRALAEAWIDFMLSPTFQEDMPLQMYVFPVNPSARLDERFTLYLAVPEHPAFVSPADIATNREAWIEAWTETVLR
jgi:thiamine transport system substrate-binding protein